MPEQDFSSNRRRRMPLAVRLSLILMLAAVLPLLLTVGITEYAFSRPKLTDQANQAMVTNATSRVQAIDAYLNERLLDAETLCQVPTVISYLAAPDVPGAVAHAGYALGAGEFRDTNYIVWMLFNAKDVPMLADPTTVKPYQYGPYLVPPEEAKAVSNDKTGRAFLSPVYYDPPTQKAFIDIYSPIYLNGTPNSTFLGFMRASLNLKYIWGIVQSDQGISTQSDTNKGSAFILDQNGVRIADTNNANLFTAVAPLSSAVQQQITSENWYGQTGNVPVEKNAVLNSAIQSQSAQTNLSLTLTFNGQSQDYQAVSAKTTVANWTYIVISPSSAVTQVADQQFLITIIVGILVAAVAAGIGLWVSNRISRPIMRSVEQLRDSSEALNGLARKQQSASSEQLWVIDSIQVGLQSVQYYTDATRIATRKLREAGTEIERNWHKQDFEQTRQGLQQLLSAADYIGRATNFQGDSSQKLATAIKVTTQVNEQLADGAISATEAASQLEQVVNDLRSVVGQ